MNKKYDELANNITNNCKIIIQNKTFTTIAMNQLNTVSNTECFYYKVQLNNNYCLLIDPFEKVIMLGEKIKDLSSGENFPEKVNYLNMTFHKSCEDYQLCKQQIFNPTKIEGECIFANYDCENNKNLFLSPGYIYRTKQRDDYLLKIIDYNDIKIIKEVNL